MSKAVEIEEGSLHSPERAPKVRDNTRKRQAVIVSQDQVQFLKDSSANANEKLSSDTPSQREDVPNKQYADKKRKGGSVGVPGVGAAAAASNEQSSSLLPFEKLMQNPALSDTVTSNLQKMQMLRQKYLLEKAEFLSVTIEILSKPNNERNFYDLRILQHTFTCVKFFQSFLEQSDSHTLQSLFKALELKLCKPYERIIQQGEKGDKFYIVLSGTVDIYSNNQPLAAAAATTHGNTNNQGNSQNHNNIHHHNNTPQQTTTKEHKTQHQLQDNETTTTTATTTTNLISMKQSFTSAMDTVLNTVIDSKDPRRESSDIISKDLISGAPSASSAAGAAASTGPSMQRLSLKNAILTKGLVISGLTGARKRRSDTDIATLYNATKVASMNPSESFGELALLNDTPRTASVFSGSYGCKLGVLNKEDFLKVVGEVEERRLSHNLNFLSTVTGFNRVSQRGLGVLIYCFQVKSFSYRESVYKERDSSKEIYIVKEGEFCLQKSIDYPLEKGPQNLRTYLENEDLQKQYIPHDSSMKTCRKVQVAVLGKGEIFGHYDAFNHMQPRSMDAVCMSQKGEIYSIRLKNLVNRCEILAEYSLLSTLKAHGIAKQEVHMQMIVKGLYSTKKFQNILVNTKPKLKGNVGVVNGTTTATASNNGHAGVATNTTPQQFEEKTSAVITQEDQGVQEEFSQLESSRQMSSSHNSPVKQSRANSIHMKRSRREYVPSPTLMPPIPRDSDTSSLMSSGCLGDDIQYRSNSAGQFGGEKSRVPSLSFKFSMLSSIVQQQQQSMSDQKAPQQPFDCSSNSSRGILSSCSTARGRRIRQYGPNLNSNQNSENTCSNQNNSSSSNNNNMFDLENVSVSQFSAFEDQSFNFLQPVRKELKKEMNPNSMFAAKRRILLQLDKQSQKVSPSASPSTVRKSSKSPDRLNVPFSHIQMTSNIDYEDLRTIVLRRLQKFTPPDYLKEMKAKKSSTPIPTPRKMNEA